MFEPTRGSLTGPKGRIGGDRGTAVAREVRADRTRPLPVCVYVSVEGVARGKEGEEAVLFIN